MGGRRVLALVVAVVLVAAACGGSDTAGSGSDDSTATPEPTPTVVPTDTPEPAPTATAVLSLEPGPTRQVGDVQGAVESWFVPQLEVVEECNQLSGSIVECYQLTVAADRDDASGGTIVLPLQVHTPRGLDPADLPADAVVAPAGGPGGSGLRPSLAGMALGRVEVAYDQRGTGDAQPDLECPGADAAFVASLQAAGSYEEESAAYDAALARCVRDLRAAGVDLTDYHSIASAHDLEDIRVALGVEQWNLIGVSYGGRLALVTMREHPESIRAAVLDSVYDLSWGGRASGVEAVDRGFDALVDACAASEPCADRGDLAEMLERVRLSFNDLPLETTVRLEGEPTDFVITGDDMIALLFVAMYRTDVLPLLPGIIAELDTGITGTAERFIADGVRFATGIADVMSYAVNCADNAGLKRFELDAQAHDVPGPYSTISVASPVCPLDWPATSPAFNEPVVSDIPSLLFAGGLDPAAPPEPTLALADHLANSTSVFMPAGGHGIWFTSPCTLSIMAEFFDDPTSPPDTSCADDFEELTPR